MIRNIQSLLIILFIIFSSCKSKSPYPGPLSPEESIKTFQFADDFKAEIFATEPLVGDPVSMVLDEQGNVYVVDMPDAYMSDAEKGKGQIVLLKDLDGDGRCDKAIVFADSLKDATSILPWKGGLLIAAAPNIMYYKDADGDGRADYKEILFTGFFNKNDASQITSLTFGIDNWIYANNNGMASEVTYTRKPDAPKLSLKGADFRFRLDRDQFERSTGPSQFGLVINDWGHRFLTHNTIHMRQVVIPLRYLERNPYLPSSAKFSVENISDHDLLMYQLSETPYYRLIRTDRRNKTFREKKLDNVEYARDHFTGVSGGTLYEGDVFPKEYYGNIFKGETSGNLIHRDVLHSNDSVPYFTAQRSAQERNQEFLASTDSWFRPTSFSVGPDGYLYVVDMYRLNLEGAISVPEDLQVDIDFKAGNKMGRIYRIAPQNAPPYKNVAADLKNTSSSDLVALLSHQNQWWRLQAQRLLLERQDKEVIPTVKDLFVQSEDGRARLHALYVLEGMDALDEAIVKTAMKDPVAGVRENAAILSERFSACLPQLEAMVSDSAIRVAFQATLSLGQFKDNSVVPALAKVLELHGQSSWFRTAVLSSESGSGIDLLKALENRSFFAKAAPWKSIFVETFSNVTGARNQKSQIVSLLENISHPAVAKIAGLQASVIKGLIKGQERVEGIDASLKEKLNAIATGSESDISKAIQDLKYLYANK